MEKKLLTKLKIVGFFFSLIVLGFFTSTSVKGASGPIPEVKFPCGNIANPEFDSLRPYQAAACGDASKAAFCSNSLIFTESFNNFPECKSQAPEGDGTFVCNTTKVIPDHTLTVNLADSQLPILGNTELTQNSQTSGNQIDDATKVNEYLSWYLSGTLNRAEDGQADPSKIVDYAGPIQKIMPQAILEAQRVSTINTISIPTTSDPENSDTAKTQTEPANHNQIVVCYSKPVSLLPVWLTNIFGVGAVGLGKAQAQPCYNGDGSSTKHNLATLRLGSWDKTPFDIGMDQVRPYLSRMLDQNTLGQLLNQAFVDRWSEKIPPLPWSDKSGQPFATTEAYQKAYNEWRGDVCAYISLPIVGKKLICVGIPGVTNNDYADLFPYIPLANTVDKHGSETDFIAEIQPSGQTRIDNKSYDTPISAPLWMAHTQETKDLSEFLNKSFTPLTCTTVEGKQTCQSVSNDPVPKTTENNARCSIVDVRTNPGDNLFPGDPHGIIVPNVHYTITQVECHKKTVYDCRRTIPHDPTSEICGYRSSIDCIAEVTITLPTITKTPFADEIWQNTVANSGSTFRRIYPKVQAGAPVSCIADIPTVTGVTYTPIDPVGGGADPGNWKVKDPSGANTTDNPQLFFPHIGSIYDYFLKGIQTALRPQGFADPTPVSGQYCGGVSCGDLPTGLPKAAGSCNMGSTSLNIPNSLKTILSAAAQTYKVPPSLILGVMFGEGDFNGGSTKRFNWTDQNVKNWATCIKLPTCSNADTSIVALPDWGTLGNQILPDLKKIDPTKTQADPCNLIDAVYGLAKNLHDNAGGSPSMTGKSCFGIPMTSTIPQNCSWNSSQYETAIRVWEIGTEYNVVTNKTCLTTNLSDLQSNGVPNVATGSCGSGIPQGTGTDYTQYLCKGGDNCETASNHSTDPALNSHNACIWDVATQGGTGNKQ